jgi:hypothetical protein
MNAAIVFSLQCHATCPSLAAFTVLLSRREHPRLSSVTVSDLQTATASVICCATAISTGSQLDLATQIIGLLFVERDKVNCLSAVLMFWREPLHQVHSVALSYNELRLIPCSSKEEGSYARRLLCQKEVAMPEHEKRFDPSGQACQGEQ